MRTSLRREQILYSWSPPRVSGVEMPLFICLFFVGGRCTCKQPRDNRPHCLPNRKEETGLTGVSAATGGFGFTTLTPVNDINRFNNRSGEQRVPTSGDVRWKLHERLKSSHTWQELPWLSDRHEPRKGNALTSTTTTTEISQRKTHLHSTGIWENQGRGPRWKRIESQRASPSLYLRNWTPS